MSTGPKSARQGERNLGGRPRKPESALSVDLREAVIAKAKATGRTIGQELVDIAYSDDKRTKMPAIKAIYDILVAPLAVEEAPEQPTADAGLPDVRPDPAKVVPIRDS